MLPFRNADDDGELLESSVYIHTTQVTRERAPSPPPRPRGVEMQRVYTVYFYTKYCRHAAHRKGGSIPAPTAAAVVAATKGQCPFASERKEVNEIAGPSARKGDIQAISLTSVHGWTLIKQRDTESPKRY